MQQSVLLDAFINDVEVGMGGEVAMAVGDTELLGKTDSSK